MSEPLRIGGTLASDILGCGFGTPLSAWAELTGKVEREDISGLEHIQAGIFLEPAAKAWFTHRTGLAVLPGKLVMDEQYPWAGGTLDGFVSEDGVNPVAVWEGKVNRDDKLWRVDDTGGAEPPIPLGYKVQGQFYLRVTGLVRVHFAAIINGAKLVTPTMDRDDEFIDSMMAELVRFLAEHVVKDIPPPTTGRDLDCIKRLWPKDTGETRYAAYDSSEALALRELLKVKAEIKALEKARDEAQAILCASMKEATELVTPYGKATWKWQQANHAAREARVVESRVLRTKEN